MRFGFPEFFLIFAAILSFQDIKISLVVGGVAAFFAFCRYAFELQEKSAKREEVENTAKLLNEQAEELGQALGNLFSTFKSDVSEKQKTEAKKYDNSNLH